MEFGTGQREDEREDNSEDKHPGKRIVVVGAGIVGASLAYHLARKGGAVTVIDAGHPASGVTGRSFAWLNPTHRQPDPIASLRGAALDDYRRLERELPDLVVRWTGSLTYGTGADDGPGYTEDRPNATRLSRQQIQDLEPNLRNPPDSAAYQRDDGAVDAVAATHALLAGAQRHGARLLMHTRVLAIAVEGSTVVGVDTSAGRIDADVLVLAAGTGIVPLARALNVDLPIEASPAIFIRYRATPERVRTLISNADMEVRQDRDGSLLAAEDYVDDAFDNQPGALARRTADAIQQSLQGISTLETEQACVGLRPIPADGVPIIGFLEPDLRDDVSAASPNDGRSDVPADLHKRTTPPAGVYVCAMHPGVTLAAVVGRLAAEEIIDGTLAPALAPCRPARFFRPIPLTDFSTVTHTASPADTGMGTDKAHIVKAQEHDLDALTDLWEASVRASHDFLDESDIAFLRPRIRHEYLVNVDVRVFRETTGDILGFVGVSDGNVDMLFLAPQARGQGIGKQLLQFAVAHMHAVTLDVNEQNPQAVGFYAHQGFEIVGRSALDGMGKPFPLLHMRLKTGRVNRNQVRRP